MKKTPKSGPFFWYVGLILIVVGLTFLNNASTTSAEQLILVGLYTLFLSRIERVDERSKALKSSSIHIAFLLSYVIKVIVAALFGKGVISFELTEINHFLILVFTLALIIYYSRLYITIGIADKN